MSSLDDKITDGMHRIAAEPPRDGFKRELTSQLRDAARRSRLRRVMLPAGGGIAAAACTAVLVNALAGGPAATTAGDDQAEWNGPEDGYNGVGVVPPGEPCVTSVHNPIDTLAIAASQNVWLPASSSDFRVTDSWACGPGGAPVLLFDDIQVSYERGWSDVEVPKKWENLIADSGGEIQTINGLPTLVHAATDIAPNNQVMYVVGDTLVRLLSVRDVPITDLVELADAIEVDTPAVKGAAR